VTVRIIHRPARITAPLARPEGTDLASPPPLGDAPVGALPLQSLLPVLGSMSSITMMVVLRSNPIMVVVGGMVLVVALLGGVGMAVSHRGNATRTRRRGRERYLDYLETTRDEHRRERDDVRASALRLDPDPGALPQLAADPERLWERRPRDPDFLRPRIGVGVVPWFGLVTPRDPNPVQPFDPIMATEADGLVRHYGPIAGMPVAVPLADADRVSLVGDPAITRPLARSLLAQLAALHAPDDLQLAIVAPADRLDDWRGADLLPHLLCEDVWDGPVRARRIAPGLPELVRRLGPELSGRIARAQARERGGATSTAPEVPLVVVVDERAPATGLPLPDGAPSADRLGITLVHLVERRVDEPGEVRLRITASADADGPRLRVHAPGDRGPTLDLADVIPDAMTPTAFAALAASLAPLRLSAASRAETVAVREAGPLELLGVDAVTDLGPRGWRARDRHEFLRVPIGIDDDGRLVHLDLKESAQLGMGPHGICIGATGSGKSELLRTLVLGLAAAHSPDDLAMILVDYKGGAAFSPFSRLPHVAGLIDNLADDAQLIERARTSIAGEVVRRQQQLKDAGSLASITEYRERRLANPAMPPMPHLFLVIDEFGELLTAEPDFIELLLTIGRIGRSIGVHMLLSSQRIEGGRLRGLDSYLSYRLGLRTFSEQESAVVLQSPDAFHLPPIPGYGYLKVDTTVYTRFRSGYVSGPVPGPTADYADDDDPLGAFVQPPYNTVDAELRRLDSELGDPAPTSGGPVLIDDAVDRLRGAGGPAVAVTAPVWLPPLPDRLPLFQVVGGDAAPLLVPIGLLDDPAHQQQGPWRLDLTRNGGHVAIIGAPQSGRSTLLRTIAAGAAVTHTPRQVSLYGLDLTGGGLARLEAFPHVGGVATRTDAERRLRLLEELAAMLAERERLFRDRRIDSLAGFRAAHAAGSLPASVVAPDLVLLVDGYGAARTEFTELEDPLADLLTRGPSFGIHLVLALTRWSELPMRLQPLIGTRIELRLNDPSESTISRRHAQTIRSDQPGRALTEDRLLAQVALPAVDDRDDEDLGDALEELARQSAAAWAGPSAAPIRLLPDDLDPAALPDEFDEPDAVPIGLRQDTMEPAVLDLGGSDPHLLALGDQGAGKTGLLRLIARGLIARRTADELVIALFEPRGVLAAELPEDYLGGHAATAQKARELASAVAGELAARQAGTSPASPRIVVLVDDYDVLGAGGTTPLDALLPYLPQARDLGLAAVLARPVAGAARALYEPLLQTLRDAGATGLILSGERSEGPLWPGIHASPTVPGRAKLVQRGRPPRLVQLANAASYVASTS
jgi:S-DNA-T family DNA segregation ATPase FtsK/SpoIIIE